MMAYLARFPFRVWLRTGLIPLLVLMLLTTSSEMSYDDEPEHGQYSIERYEHKMAQPTRSHSPVLKSVLSIRFAHRGLNPADQPESPAPVCCVSLDSLIYITLKRLLLHPIQYSSNYVSARINFTTA